MTPPRNCCGQDWNIVLIAKGEGQDFCNFVSVFGVVVLFHFLLTLPIMSISKKLYLLFHTQISSMWFRKLLWTSGYMVKCNCAQNSVRITIPAIISFGITDREQLTCKSCISLWQLKKDPHHLPKPYSSSSGMFYHIGAMSSYPWKEAYEGWTWGEGRLQETCTTISGIDELIPIW